MVEWWLSLVQTTCGGVSRCHHIEECSKSNAETMLVNDIRRPSRRTCKSVWSNVSVETWCRQMNKTTMSSRISQRSDENVDVVCSVTADHKSKLY